MNEATNNCRNNSAYAARMNTMNVTLTASKPAAVLAWAARDIAVWKPLIDKLGLAVE